MKKGSLYIILLMVVLIASIAVSVSSLFSGNDNDKSNNDTVISSNPPVDDQSPSNPGLDIVLPGASQTPQTSQTPQNTPAPQNTPRPQNTPAPTPKPQPTPTPQPTPAPTPVQTVSGSGSFTSNTGTGLNIQVDWKAYNDAAGNVMLEVKVSASHYSFYTSALYNAVEVKVGGSTYYANSPDVSYDGDALKIDTLATFNVPAAKGNVNIEAIWHYNGSYSGKDLKDIVAAGSAWIG